ncbi:type II secretion system F family protein [uncultured Gimesia sp.]|uniref:type II secretion system F family protein n=1 Tax=uncultured Gimesia sp. TaxID=1678688 RepID=UPI00261322B5|nr:type II secretion system F family protein [uncultured Gimesia sp.]
MNRYSYLCIDDEGQEKEGFLQAVSDESARIQLMKQGLKIIRVDLCGTDDSMTSEAALEITDFSGDQLSKFGKAAWNSESEYLDIASQSSHFKICGVPLSASLRTLAEETTSKKLSRAFKKIAVELEEGKTAEESFKQNLNDVPENLVSLIKAGSQTGKLDSIIEDYIDSQRLLAQSRHKIMLSLFYTSVLFFGSFLIFYFLMVNIVGNFKKLLSDFGTELPGLTLLVISLSDLMSLYGLRIIFWLIVISSGIWFSFDLFKMRGTRRRLLNSIPVFGRILNYTSIAQFCRMLATLIEAQIKLPEALELAAQITRDPNLIEGCDLLKKRIQNGLNLTEVAKETRHFSKNFAHIFRWQDRPELFVDSLRASSNIFQAKANMKTGSLVFALQPLVLAGIVLIIGIPVIALFMPLIKLLNDLS